ncbi:alpha/beta hydrolase family protein [Cognatitamlana onchidii]|uniref:alpha/beta hydrolase family protein n=1 Tax=Cognatitamlana onchidii TaxID=2562860 RepID=UPI0010A67871|nr:hypothetical protein [Algibacter onchidii]
MRLFEILLALISFILVLQSFSAIKIKQPKYILPSITCIFFLIHLFYEGMRWQMSLIYLILFCTILALLFNLKIRNKIVKWIVFFFCVLGIVISYTLSYLIPIFSLPKTNGKFTIVTLNQTTSSDLEYKIWLPTKQDLNSLKSNYHQSPSNDLDGLMGMPGFIFSHLKLVKTNAFQGNETIKTENKKPLILYSHGASSTEVDNTALIEELVSHGYVVAAVNHKFSFKQYGLDINDAKKIEIEAQKTLINQLIKKAVPNQVSHYKAIIHELKLSYPNQIDFNNIVLIGHSLGGATACSGALEIKNVKAVVNMDGPIDLKITSNFSLPLLYFSSFSPDLSEDELKKLQVPPSFYKGVKKYELEAVQELFNNNRDEKYWARFKNANHLDFTDIPYMIPMMSAPNYDKVRGHELKTKIILSFIAKQLNGSHKNIVVMDASLEWIKPTTANMVYK